MRYIALITSLLLIFTLPVHAKQEPSFKIMGKVEDEFANSLLKVKISKLALRNIKSRIQASNKFSYKTVKGLPAKQQIGMGHVPVFEQGKHGSCATFANTAAIDAALYDSDYISQLCHLTFGHYLENNGYTYSGWDGSSARYVLSQIELFGIINKTKELEHGCGGLFIYPLNDIDITDAFIDIKDFHSLSEEIIPRLLQWYPLLDETMEISRLQDAEDLLYKVKKTLLRGDRMTLGMLIPEPLKGCLGASASYQAQDDTWVLDTPLQYKKSLNELIDGHELIITGYDDNAVAIDQNGIQHLGLLTLRNSWGANAGDHGDFYMSYDYFKVFAMEVYVIHKVSKNIIMK
jgi:Peptidase C1-like family